MFCYEIMKRFYSFNQIYLLACLVGLCVCVCCMYIYHSNRIVFLWMICNRVQGIFLFISEEVSSFMKRPLFCQCFKCFWCHKSSVSVPGGYLKADYFCPVLLVYPCSGAYALEFGFIYMAVQGLPHYFPSRELWLFWSLFIPM